MSLKFYIPKLGDRIRLTKDWTFDLYHESRNDPLFFALEINPWPFVEDRYNGKHNFNRNNETTKVTIPAGSILVIDRIYIRKGSEDYDSVTFRWDREKQTVFKFNYEHKIWTGYEVEGKFYTRDHHWKLCGGNKKAVYGYHNGRHYSMADLRTEEEKAFAAKPFKEVWELVSEPMVKKVKSARFWTKLDAANTIEFEPVELDK